MLNSFLLNILLHALGSAPSIIEDVQAGFAANWNVPHVQQATQGVKLLAKLIADLEGSVQPNGAVVGPVAVADTPVATA